MLHNNGANIFLLYGAQYCATEVAPRTRLLIDFRARPVPLCMTVGFSTVLLELRSFLFGFSFRVTRDDF